MIRSFLTSIQQKYYAYAANDAAYDSYIPSPYYTPGIINAIKYTKRYESYISKLNLKEKEGITQPCDLMEIFKKNLLFDTNDTERFDLLFQSGYLDDLTAEHIQLVTKHAITLETPYERNVYVYKLCQILRKLYDQGYELTHQDKKMVIKSFYPMTHYFDIKSVKHVLLNVLRLDNFNGSGFLHSCIRYIKDKIVLEQYVDFLLDKSFVNIESKNFMIILRETIYPSITKKIIEKLLEKNPKEKCINKIKDLYLLKIAKNKLKKREHNKSLYDDYNDWKDYVDYLIALFK